VSSGAKKTVEGGWKSPRGRKEVWVEEGGTYEMCLFSEGEHSSEDEWDDSNDLLRAVK